MLPRKPVWFVCDSLMFWLCAAPAPVREMYHSTARATFRVRSHDKYTHVHVQGEASTHSVVENAKRHDAAQFQRSPPAFHKTTVPAICTFGGMPADLAPRVRMTSQHTIHKDVCAMGGYYSVSLGLWSHVCRRNDCVGFWNCPATATHSRHLLLNVPPMVALGFWAPG